MQGSYSWAYGLTSLSEKTRKCNHLQMLEQRQHFLLNYFKTLSGGPGIEPETSRTADWRLTNWANQAAVKVAVRSSSGNS